MSHILGQNYVDNYYASNAGNVLTLTRTQAPASGDISVLKCKVYSLASAGNIKMGMYADNAGSPGVFLGKTAEVAVSATGWIETELTSDVSVVADTWYWIAVQKDTSFSGNFEQICSDTNARYKSITYDTWTDSPSSLTSTKMFAFCGFIEASAGGGSIGWTSDYGNLSQASGNYRLICNKVKTHEACTITKMSAYLKRQDSSANVVTFGIYTDSAGSPGTLVASGTEASLDTGSLVNQYVEGDILATLTADTFYWLVIQCDGNFTMVFQDAYYPGQGRYSASITYGTFPSSPSTTNWADFRVLELSAYYEAPSERISTEESLGILDGYDFGDAETKHVVGNTPSGTWLQKATMRQIVRASNGTLVLFSKIDTLDLAYKISTDNGNTWSSSWTNVITTMTQFYGFDAYIDSSDDIHIAVGGYITSSKTLYQKLSYVSGNTWTVESLVTVASQTPYYGNFVERSNGDYAIASRDYYNYSDDSGATWSAITHPASSKFRPNGHIAVGSDIWLFSNDSGTINYYIYTTSFGSAQQVATGITYVNDAMSVLKISDTDIWVAGQTSSGIKMFHYNGTSWDAGTLISNNALDNTCALSVIDGKAIATWIDYDGTNYNFAYRIYNGTSWDAQVALTNTTAHDLNLTAINSDDDYLLLLWMGIGSATPYDVVVTTFKVSDSGTIVYNVFSMVN